ncbi:MAG: RNA polymerase sigma-70 factor [Cyclobacteriaceae bacterium]|nr:RNA polymerase sigma-70 factor [Cyclobacteriaceae bacterium]
MNTISTLVQQQARPYAPTLHCGNQGIDQLFQRVALHNDAVAFERLFNKTYRSLCHLSSRIVHSIELAEEVVDDVFYNFWKNRKDIQIKTSFASYLVTSVRNRSLDCLRKSKNTKHASIENIPDVPCGQSIALEAIVYEELSRKIQAAIQTLPPQCRIIFLMSRNEEITYKEIAEKLNLSIKTIDTQMGRALKHLRGELNISNF